MPSFNKINGRIYSAYQSLKSMFHVDETVFFFFECVGRNHRICKRRGSLRLHTIILTMSFCEAALRHVNQADHLEKGNMQLP